MGSSDVFWAKDPCILFQSFSIFPTPNMTKNEKLNALSRLAIAISVIMYFMEYQHWFIFLILSLLVIVILAYASNPEAFSMKKMDSDEKEEVENGIEKFTVTPTYVGTDFQQTVVSPTFSEEWQIPPPAYDLYTNVPYPNDPQSFDTPMKPQAYPYGQYLTRTNLLPSDEYYTHLGCGGPRTARAYVNSAFTRHAIAHRENMMRIYKKKLNRRFRNNCQDTFSPYNSF
jgi:hypothetical protein